MATMRKKRNFIHAFQTSEGIVTYQSGKHKAVYDYFL
jgi:hypothetical protein